MFTIRVHLLLLVSYFHLAYTADQSILASTSPSWQQVASTKREMLLSKIPTVWRLPQVVIHNASTQRSLTEGFLVDLLDSTTLEITSHEPVDILANIHNGTWTALRVTKAFCKRSAYVHQLSRNLLEILYAPALEHAEDLDRIYRQTGTIVGPLHGLPVTLKDQFHVAGGETTLGYVGWINTFEGQRNSSKSGAFESELVTTLKSLGAIPIAKTTLSQALESGETSNNILGYLRNPVNQMLSAGGSSGGEGANQALRGSAIGFGTDIGGSVTIPAAFNGVYGLKPSKGRISYKGAATVAPGQTVISSVIGILGPSLTSLKLMFMALLSTEPWRRDPDLVPLPGQDARPETSPRVLRIGIFRTDGYVTPHPPILRALNIMSSALREAGHDLVSWEPPSHTEASDIWQSFVRADGFDDAFTQFDISGEPPTSEFMRSAGTKLRVEPEFMLEFFNMSLRLRDYREQYTDYWSSMGVDAVIMPVAPHAAVLPGQYYSYQYSSIMDMLDYPAIVVPVTTANREKDEKDPVYKPLNDVDEKNYKAYDAAKYHGAPASLQIVGRRLGEQRLFEDATIVHDALQRHISLDL